MNHWTPFWLNYILSISLFTKPVQTVARLDSFFNPDGTFLPSVFFLFYFCLIQDILPFMTIQLLVFFFIFWDSRPIEIRTKVLPDFSRAECILLFLFPVSLILFASRKEIFLMFIVHCMLTRTFHWEQEQLNITLEPRFTKTIEHMLNSHCSITFFEITLLKRGSSVTH